MMADQLFIVAEVSKNWPENDHDGMPRLLSERFEAVIERNLQRGYRLHSWRLSQWSPEPGYLNETIIAVFTRSSKV
jgi:hypothetical protein